MFYRRFLLALGVAAVALTLSPDASALLRIGSGGSSSTKTCPDGTTVPSDSTCPGSTLTGSLWGVYSGFLRPDHPVFLDAVTLALKCTQGALECLGGTPAIQIKELVTFSRGAKTITLADPIKTWASLGIPPASVENPVKIQTAGFVDNNGSFTVIGNVGRVLTLLERPRNEFNPGLVALSDASFQFTDLDGNPDLGTAYFRKFADPVVDADLQCITVPGDLNGDGMADCTDGVATTSGGFTGTLFCASTGGGLGTQLTLPCTVKSFAGKDTDFARFHFLADKHNFPECGGGTVDSVDCYINWGTTGLNVNPGFCKKYLPAVDGSWESCQTWQFGITLGESITSILHRTFVSVMGIDADAAITTARPGSTNAQGEVEVEVSAPSSLNVNPGTLNVNVDNQTAADLSGIDLASVVLRFSAACSVDDLGNPTFNATSAVFKWDRTELLCAYARSTNRATSVIPNGESVPLNFFGEYTQSGGAVSGTTTSTLTGGDFDAGAVCAAVSLPKCPAP